MQSFRVSSTTRNSFHSRNPLLFQFYKIQSCRKNICIIIRFMVKYIFRVDAKTSLVERLK